MIEPGWISFNTAANKIRKRFGCGWAEAKARLRGACAVATIETRKAPLDPEPMPLEFWSGLIAASEWRDREVDQDGPDCDGCKIEVMLNEDDFERWLESLPQPAADNRRDAAIRKLLKTGLRPPDDIQRKAFCKKVLDEAGCDFSERTIKRAVKKLLDEMRPKQIFLRRVDKPVS
jgi:hypothetical protein